MKQETIAVPVEVVRELKRLSRHAGGEGWMQLIKKVQALPEPKPDVVEECARALKLWAPALADGHTREMVKVVILRYRELGCPELDE